jgi:hypothetical protein
MKKIFLLAAAFAFSYAGFAQTDNTNNNTTTTTSVVKADDVIKVNTEKYDFGKVKQNEPPVYYFEIKNISNKPIVVENTWASCGCTTPDKITEPIAPGSTVKLKVQYNAAAAAPFTKDVYIKLAGIDQPKTLQISGEVLAADAYDAWVKDHPKTEVKTEVTTEVKTVPAKTKTKTSTTKEKTKTTSVPSIGPAKNNNK